MNWSKAMVATAKQTPDFFIDALRRWQAERKPVPLDICPRCGGPMRHVCSWVPSLRQGRSTVLLEEGDVMDLTPEQIEIAGRAIKVIRLVNIPGMDDVAVKLNCGLTYDEQVAARRWAAAFELARSSDRVFDIAAKVAMIR